MKIDHQNLISCTLCGSNSTTHLIDIAQRPQGETNFNIPIEKYFRAIHLCNQCEVYFSIHNYDFNNFYSGNYNNSTYKNNLEHSYTNIMSLPDGKSDNKVRCQRIHDFLTSLKLTPCETNILDIGSGLCVFLGQLKTYGSKCFALDPDSNSISHALNYVKVDGAFCGDINDFYKNEYFDLISLNKVLEHVKNPINLLSDSLKKLKLGKFCYIELPDGKSAHRSGGLINQEEFFIEHFYAFTKKSLEYLLNLSKLDIIEINSIKEPSGKFTVYALAKKTIR